MENSIQKIERKLILSFKYYWSDHNGYMSLELSDEQIIRFVVLNSGNIPKAVEQARDFLLANDLSEVIL